MKRRQLLLTMVLSLGCAWGSVGCLVTAFNLAVTEQLAMGAAWLLWAAVCALLLPRRRGGLLPGLGLLAALGYACYAPPLRRQLLSLLGTVARVYDSGYGWGIPAFLQVETVTTDVPLTLLGFFLILSVSGALCRRRGSAEAVCALMVPLVACLVMTDTVPDRACLFVLLLGIVLLLLTAGVRQESSDQGARLCMAAVLPVAAALGLLFWLVPRESYVNTSQALRDKVAAYAQLLPEKIQAGEAFLSHFSSPRQQVNLASLSAQSQLEIPVAEVTASQAGTLYLRGQDFDVYTGMRWQSSSNRQETLAGTGEAWAEVTVQVLNAQSSLLIPSFPDGETILQDGMVVNEEGLREYTLLCRSQIIGPQPGSVWLSLPEETELRAKAIVNAIAGSLDTTESIAAAVADYVRGTAVYDRETRAMPGGYSDFALWFLEEADRGYCVHFATAAAVLLRSVGIPARYVTGYKVDVTPGAAVQVTSDDAHAWVEYYNYKTWTWEILEATPGELTLEEAPEQTQPETQTQPTGQTQPTAETLPQPTLAAPAPQEQTRQFPWKAFAALLAGAGIWGLAELQRLLRIHIRRRRQSRGTPNAQAALRWRELGRQFRLLGIAPPEELRALTEKALFSQHILTPEELGRFADCAAASRRALKNRPWYRRFLYRYWYAMI